MVIYKTKSNLRSIYEEFTVRYMMTATAPPHTLQMYMVMRHPIDSPMAPETEARPPPMYTPDAKRPAIEKEKRKTRN